MTRKRTAYRESGFTVLVVDDQEETLESVSALLGREGHRVLTADSGAKALDLFRRNEVHLLLVDYFMPRMTGEELVREIRRLDRHVQIVLQTGYSGEKPPRQMLRDLDIQGYHSKSDGPERLLLWVDVALKAHVQMTKVLDAERLKSAMLTNLSHEFRTPLTTVMGYGELLREGFEEMSPEEIRDALDNVLSASERLLEMIDDFLAMVSLDAGQLTAAAERVCIADVVTEAMENLRPQADAKGLKLCATVDRDIQAITDPQKLRLLVSALVSNAIKFTDKGEVRLSVARDEEWIALSVADTGIGIDPAQHEAIFERFRQLDGSLSRRREGMGLGLALVKDLAALLGGTIGVQSSLGAGSTFTLRLPSRPEQKMRPCAPPPVPSQMDSAAGGSP